MVNLRYHVVSLIAVFLALAVGVFLGAGPLQLSIAGQGQETAEGKVTELTSEVESLKASAADQDTFASAVAATVTKGTLADKNVALLLLPGVETGTADTVKKSLENAGATVTGLAQLGTAAVSLGQRDYRDSLATPVAGHLEGKAGGTADDTLATAVIEVLTKKGADRDILEQILSDDKTPLLESATVPEKPAESVVIVGPKESGEPEEGDLEAPTLQALEAFATAVALAPKGGVAVGAAAKDGDFITSLRQSEIKIATVDGIGTPVADTNLPLALADPKVDAYGTGELAQTPMAPMTK